VTDAVAEAPSTYSKYSYYTTLGLYALSFPGLISLVTRSVKSKDVRRTFEAPGPNAKEGKGKELKVVAGEVMAYFLSQNYKVCAREGGKEGGTEGVWGAGAECYGGEGEGAGVVAGEVVAYFLSQNCQVCARQGGSGGG